MQAVDVDEINLPFDKSRRFRWFGQFTSPDSEKRGIDDKSGEQYFNKISRFQLQFLIIAKELEFRKRSEDLWRRSCG
jgi:hypothetical protein